MKENGPYRIVGDDSGHDYIIPVARSAEWDAWVGSELWENELPEWAERIDGNFVITAYRLDSSVPQKGASL